MLTDREMDGWMEGHTVWRTDPARLHLKKEIKRGEVQRKAQKLKKRIAKRKKMVHYGPKYEKVHRKDSHLIIHFFMSEGVSKVRGRANEWAQRSARGKRVVRSKRTSEWCERTSERTSEWPNTYIWVFGCSGLQCKNKLKWKMEISPNTLAKYKRQRRDLYHFRFSYHLIC